MPKKSPFATVEEVAKALHKSNETIRCGLQQRVFPWGYAIECAGGRWSYIINRLRFEQIEGISLQGGTENDEREEN